jgi:hypothetical protein
MTFRGYIKGGRIVFDEPVDLPEGTEVELRRAPKTPRKSPKPKPAKPGSSQRASKGRRGLKKSSGKSRRKREPTIFERYRAFIGKATGLPSDFAAQHDHYIHGAPKR